MNNNPPWFPSFGLSESFSEWQERCATDFVDSTSSIWYSVLFRLHSWAQSQNSSSSTNQNDIIPQQQQMIASPWSRAPPKLDSNNQHEGNSRIDHQQHQQQQHDDDAGLIVRPVVWLLFVKNSEDGSEDCASHFKLAHMTCAPPDLAQEVDSEYFSLVDLGQWHSAQIAKLLDHTPSGRYPRKILIDSKLSSLATLAESEESEQNARCSRFACQAQASVKIVKEKNIPITDDNNNTSNNVEGEADIQNLLSSSKAAQMTKILQAASFVPRTILPPDQSDPLFFSKYSSAANGASSNLENFIINNGSNHKIPLIFKFDRNEGQHYQYALAVPLSILVGMQHHFPQESNFNIIVNSYRRSKRNDAVFKKLLETRIGFVRFFSDLGDAIEAGKIFLRENLAVSRAAYWGDLLAPTCDSGGVLVVESWGTSEMMNHEDFVGTSHHENVSCPVLLHAYVEIPVEIDSEGATVKQQRMPGELSSVRLYRREVNESEISFLKSLNFCTQQDGEVNGTKKMTIGESETELLKLTSIINRCSWCNRLRQTNKKCGRCFSVAYCSRSHQILHFKEVHRKECAAMQPSAKDAANENDIVVGRSIANGGFSENEIADSFANVVLKCLGNINSTSSFQKSAITVCLQLPSQIVNSTNRLCFVTETICKKIVEQNALNQNAFFITICCDNEKSAGDSSEDFLGVYHSDCSSSQWLPKSATLGDLWFENSVTEKISSSNSGFVLLCRVHRFGSIDHVVNNKLTKPSKHKKYYQSAHDEEITNNLIIVFHHGPQGLNFFDSTASEMAGFISTQGGENNYSFLVSDTLFSAEISSAVVGTKIQENFGTEINRPPAIHQKVKENSSFVVAPDSVKNKVLLPLVLNGYVTKY